MVLVQVRAGECTGLGWTYGDLGSATVIHSTLRDVVVGSDALRVTAAWQAMARGQKDRVKILETVLEDKVREVL
jgi:hypothetical protein